MKLKLCLTAALAAFAALPVFCETVTLNECLERAYKANYNILTSRNSVLSSEQSVKTAKSGYYPQVSVRNNFLTSNHGVLSQHRNGTAISISQNIYDGGIRESNVRGAKYGVEQSEFAEIRNFQSVTYEVKTAYYSLLRAKHQLEVTNIDAEYNQNLLDQINAQVEVGVSAPVDKYPIEANLAAAKVSNLTAKNDVRSGSIRLLSILGEAPDSDFDVAEAAPEIKGDVSLDECLAKALEVRPDIAQYKAASKVADERVRRAKINRYPRPTVTAEYQQSIHGGYNEHGLTVLGGISFDVFDGGANKAALTEARIDKANTELRLAQLDIDVRGDVEDAYLEVKNCSEKLTATQAALTSAEKNYEAQKERYVQGLGIALDLLSAEQQLIKAKTADVDARYDYYTAPAKLEYAVGDLEIDPTIVEDKEIKEAENEEN
ncbi:MAG: TolC family protein [Abditibacteriota bacterium]|nr:TolC family protein [Abditibacteriota bacterium]